MGSRISLTVSINRCRSCNQRRDSPWSSSRIHRRHVSGTRLSVRITDLFLAFPSLLLAMAIDCCAWSQFSEFHGGSGTVLVAVVHQACKYQGASLRERPLVEAARAMGVPDKNIIARHILPNSLAPVIVQATVEQIGTVVLRNCRLEFHRSGCSATCP